MQIVVGEVVECKVTGTTKFGAFVDLGEGKSGMIHISEVAQTYVSEIGEFVKVGDVVKAKVLSVSEDGKISLSIKKAQPPVEQPQQRPKNNGPRNNAPRNNGFKSQRPQRQEPDYTSPAAVWTPKKSESASFEDMMAKFKQTSDEKFSDLKRKNPETRRPKRATMK